MKARQVSQTQVQEFTELLFGDDMHANRVLSLGNAAMGFIRAGVLGVHAIGRGLALAQERNEDARCSAPHGKERVWLWPARALNGSADAQCQPSSPFTSASRTFGS